MVMSHIDDLKFNASQVSSGKDHFYQHSSGTSAKPIHLQPGGASTNQLVVGGGGIDPAGPACGGLSSSNGGIGSHL